ncbi:major intrinsically disordered Notch2-binding receptor 1 [Cyclopterus lumpus]|uniref:major intrinsically disordered Notch2-binding receptor 1 n=1 Tax=Cyclopterus lumpus TaxID=8103 RepID=UPI00148618D6|nr:major intrinsically disordered Notch2-binding receptor 1 [Cyclopterus lumpus]
MANPQPEYPEVLLGILEELANMRQWLTFQDLCRMVSTRFDLEHLFELRSLLFAAASQDPCFPATLFRDRVSTRGQGLSPIGVAADIVTIFNLIQMTAGASDDSQPVGAQTVLPVDQSPGPRLPGIQQLNVSGGERARAHSDSSGGPIDQHLLFPRSNYSAHKRASLPPDPISLVSSPPIRARAVSFDLPHTTLVYPIGQVPNEVMKNIYQTLETDSESSGDSAPMEVFEDEQGSSVDQKRSTFRKDFHNQPTLTPQVTVDSESPSPNKVQKGFDNHSFETIPNPYASSATVNQSPEQRAKHESLNDLQDSTYFGPRPIPDWSPRHLLPPRSKRPIWSNKSHSLEDRIGPGSMGMEMESQGGQLPKRSTPAISIFGVSSGCESGDGVKAQGTQTDPPDTRRLRSLVHADRFSFMTSLDDPDIGEDDISAIFRFLDDISMCGSTGVLHHSDGSGAINQDTHEARRGRLGQLSRLFHSLESTDDGLKSSVCKLLLRMSQIERQLDSLNDVKAEISQVLSALQRLDEKIQQPIGGDGQGTGGRWLEPLSGVSSFMSHPITPSESSEPQPLSVSEHLFPGISTSSLDWNRWNTPGELTEISNGDSKGGREGKKDASSRRASKTQPEEKNLSDSKQLNVSHSAKDWTVSFSKSKDGKSSHGQADQSGSTTNLISKKSSNLVDQVFNSSLFRHKDTGPTSGKILDPRMSAGRGRPIWTVDDREARISSLDLQTQESLNPNNMEFWMDDVYTPGYDALLRRKEADLRRAKVCKMAALIAAAVVIILIIVIPLCTMGL